jgi:predicted metal-dependent peptidase
MGDTIDLKIRKCKLLLFTNELIFFGMSANKFNWVIRDLNRPEIEGQVLFAQNDMNKVESGEIIINQYFIEKEDYNFANLAFLICHELMHILNKHGLRVGDRNHDAFNIAGDHTIDRFLKNINKLQPYQNIYNIIDQLEKELPNCTTEQAYDWIINSSAKQNFNYHRPDSESGIHVSDKNDNELFITNPEVQGLEGQLDPGEQSLIEQFVAESRAVFENLKEKGAVSSFIKEYLDNILKVEIPWHVLVERSIKTNVIMKPDDRSWRVLNKFYIALDLTLPGYTMTEDVEGVGMLIITADSSGSVNTSELKKFSHIIEMSMKYFKEIHLLVHDVNVQQHKIFTKDNIYQFYEFIKKEGYHGRGGTSHKPVFTKIEEEFWKEKKDDLSMVISLTDGYSDIENIISRYDWIKNNTPLTFIITKGGKLPAIDNAIGNILNIKMN